MAAEQLVEVEVHVLPVVSRTHHAGESHLKLDKWHKGLDTGPGCRRKVASHCLDHHIGCFDHRIAADIGLVWEELGWNAYHHIAEREVEIDPEQSSKC
jgi:hypothetical protein